MVQDLDRHGRILRRFIRDSSNRIVPSCIRRMIVGQAAYERPGFVDERDMLAEANDEILDAMNYPAMWVTGRNGTGDDPILARYFRHLQSAHALLQLMRSKDDKLRP